MPPIRFAINSYQSRALPLSAQQLVNYFAEAAPNDAKSPVALLNSPGIKTFCNNVGDGPIRGMEVMDDILYVVSGDELWAVRPGCDNTRLGSIGVGADSGISAIAGTGITKAAETLFTITGGTDSGGTISSITVGGVELLVSAVTFTTDAATTADLVANQTITAPFIPYDVTQVFDSHPWTDTFLNVTTPSETEEGDFLVAHVGVSIISDDPVVITGPDGWSELLQDSAGPGINPGEVYVSASTWYKFANASDVDGGVTYQWTFDVSGNLSFAEMIRVQNVDLIFPIHAYDYTILDINHDSFFEVPILNVVADHTRLYTLVQIGDQDNGTKFDGDDDSFGLLAHREVGSGGTNGFLAYSWFYDPDNESGPGKTPPGITDTVELRNAVSGPPSIVTHIAFGGAQTSIDYTMTPNTKSNGSIIVQVTEAAGGQPSDYNGLDVVITTTGDTQIECG